MPPLEALADAMVAALNASDLTPRFVARWDYLTTYDIEDRTPEDPADILLLIRRETTSVLNRAILETSLDVQVVIRKKIGEADKETILPLRELAESVYYYWAPPRERRIASVQKVWTGTVVDMPYEPDELREKHLFFSIATLTFGLTR